MAKRTNRLAWGLAVVLAVSPFAGCGDPFGGRRFHQHTWLAGLGNGLDRPRLPMARDLLDHYLKPGMSHEQVIQLLGKPDEHYTRAHYKKRTGFSDREAGLRTRIVEEYSLG